MANELDILRERLRQTGTVGLADALAYQILSYSQQTFNAIACRMVSSKGVTVSANTLVLDIRSDIDSAATTVVSAKYDNDSLIRLDDWCELYRYDRDWLTRTHATEPFKVFTQIGTDLVVVYPGCTTQKTVTFYYADLTTEINDSGDDMEVPAEDQMTVHDMAELIAHLHLRNIPECQRKLEDLKKSIAVGYPNASHTRSNHGAY